MANQILNTPEAIGAATKLLPMLKNGTYAKLTNEIYKLRNESNPIKLEQNIIAIAHKYSSKLKRPEKKDIEPIQPKIIISETFVK